MPIRRVEQRWVDAQHQIHRLQRVCTTGEMERVPSQPVRLLGAWQPAVFQQQRHRIGPPKLARHMQRRPTCPVLGLQDPAGILQKLRMVE